MVGRSSCNLQKITEGPQENGSRWAERKADMILTVTLNPAVDKTYRTGELFPGRVNRMRSVDNIPGGKGINVSKILRQYDYEVTATGFLGGYQGKWMEAQLDRLKIRSAFVHVEEETRSSMNIVADNGYVTEILEPGPHISASEGVRRKLYPAGGGEQPDYPFRQRGAGHFCRYIRKADTQRGRDGEKSDSGYQRRAAEGRDSGGSRCCEAQP